MSKKEKTAKKETRKERRLKNLRHFDLWIFLPYIALSALGVVMVYSASSYRLMMQDNSSVMGGVKQLTFLIIGLVLLFGIYIFIRNRFIDSGKFAKGLMFIAILLLIIVLIFGQKVNGAKGWLNLGLFQLQPLEVFKLALILYAAHYFVNVSHLSYMSKVMFWGSFLLGILLLLCQPDTGGVLITVLLLTAIWLCSGAPFLEVVSYIGLAAMVIALAALILPHVLGGYRLDRFLVAYHPFDYARGAGHQLVNSYYAINNGGWFGVGLGKSIEKQGFLPEAQTDFIFSIIVEELGLITGFIVIALLAILIFRIFYIGFKSQSRQHMLICVGIGTWIFLQMFVNLGGLLGIIPLTGVNLPFLSQGGSSMIMLSVAIAIAMKISANEYDYRKRKPLRHVKVFE